MLAIILSMIGLAIFYVVLGMFITKPIIVKIGAYLVATFEVLMMFGVVFLNEVGSNIEGVLRTNFWISTTLAVVLLLWVGLGMIFRWGDMSNNDPDADPKWVR